MTQLQTLWHGFGAPAAAGPESFAPDRFMYDLVRLSFLPWTMMEETARMMASTLAPEGGRP